VSVPAECLGIYNQVEGFRDKRDDLQQELQTAAPARKPFIVREIRTLNAQIAELEDDLAVCVAAAPVPATPPGPALTITRLEVTQAIQTAADSVVLVANKRTAVRVFVDSGLAPSAPGGGLLPQVTGSLVVTDTATGASATLQALNAGGVISARPAASINPDVLNHSLLFELPSTFLQGTVRLSARATAPGLSSLPSMRTLSFVPQPSQEILPILLSDPLLLLQSPSRAVFTATLAGARRRMPVPDSGFIVKPPIETVLSPGIDLRGTFGWNWLAFNLATWVFLFPTQDVGGLRTALVPMDSRYALNGIGTTRKFLSLPAVAAQAGLPATLAHEYGHAFGLDHAPCPAPGTPGAPTDVDPLLPGTLPAAGLDLEARSVVPAGTGEIMALASCSGQGRWPSAQYWEFVRVRVPI
jgi:hypothetical protein